MANTFYSGQTDYIDKLNALAISLTAQLTYMGVWSASSSTYPTIPARGYYYKISVAGTINSVNYIIGDTIIYNGVSWDKLTSPDAVISVAGKTGAVLITAVDVGLTNVDNTSDINKPLSTIQVASLALKANLLNPLFTTPTLGVATATTINKLSITTPATGSTLTLLDGKTLVVSNSITLAGTDSSVLNIGSGGTLGTGAYSAIYSLPFASATTLGGIKIGSGLTIDGTGILSSTATSVSNLAQGTNTATNVVITSSSGTSATLTPASSTTAGILSATDWSNFSKVSGDLTPVSVSTTGNITVGGNLVVNGTTVTLNATTLNVADLNITVGSGATNSALANGAGLTVGTYTSNPTLLYGNTLDNFTFNRRVDAISFVGPLTGNVTGNITGTAGSVSQATDPTPSTYRILLGNATNIGGAVYNKTALYWNDNGSIIQGANISGNAATATNIAWGGITGKPTTLSGYSITDIKNNGVITVQAVVGSSIGCTTAQFVAWYQTNFNFLAAVYTVAKCTWSYAGNNTISDTNIGNVETAGAVIETYSDGALYTIKLTLPSTGIGAGQELIYSNQGSGYSPGWRTALNTNNYNSYSLPLIGGTLTGILQVNNQIRAGQNTNGTAYIDAYGGFAYYGCDSNTTGMKINSLGAAIFSSTITATNFSGSSSGTNTGDQVNISGTSNTSNFLNWNNVLTYGASGLEYFNMSQATSNIANANCTPTSDWNHIIRMNHGNASGYYVDISAGLNASYLHYRRITSGVANGWYRIMDDSCIGSFAPTLTGGGASGSWPISITGMVSSTTTEILRVSNSSGYLSGFNTGGTVRTGYIQFNSGANINITAEQSNGLVLSTAGGSLTLGTAGNIALSSYLISASTIAATDFNATGAIAAVGTGIAASGIQYYGNGIAHANIAWLPNERTFNFRTGNGYRATADTWGACNVSISGTVNAVNFSGSHTGTSSGTNTGDQTNISGNAGTVSNLVITKVGTPATPDTVSTSQIGYTTGMSLFGQADGGLYTAAYDATWMHQVYGDFRSGQIAVRGKNSGTWQAWRTVLDSSNYSTYAAAASHTHGGQANVLYQGFTLDANTMVSGGQGFTYSINAPFTGPILSVSTGGGYDLQINAGYSNTNVAYRTRNGDTNVWQAWNSFITAANIGTQSVAYAAEVNAAFGRTDTTAYPVCWIANNTNKSQAYSCATVTITSSTGQLSASILYSSGNVTAYSDERVKTNWRSLTSNFTEKLSLVKSGIYDRLDQKLTQIGVSAQSLQTVIPEAVIEEDNGQLSVSYGHAALAACIELAKEIVLLKKELEYVKLQRV